jgi:hypothetical protein
LWQLILWCKVDIFVLRDLQPTPHSLSTWMEADQKTVLQVDHILHIYLKSPVIQNFFFKPALKFFHE